MNGGVRTAWLLIGVASAAAGCSSTSTSTPNPFTSADRVPPPMLRTTPAAPYPGVPAGPPPVGTGPYGTGPAGTTFAAPAPYGATATTPLPSVTPYGAAAPTYAPTAPLGAASPAYGAPPASGVTSGPSAWPASNGSATASPYGAASGPLPGPAPGTATPYYGASIDRGAVGGGDTIAIPGDSGALRFAGPAEAQLVRQNAGPVSRTAIAAGAPRRPATANGWLAGSAPLRTDVVAGAPRVRMPGESFGREPVSLAAIEGVRIAPLEPSPGQPRPGEPTPLRVATPPSRTGWR